MLDKAERRVGIETNANYNSVDIDKADRTFVGLKNNRAEEDRNGYVLIRG